MFHYLGHGFVHALSRVSPVVGFVIIAAAIIADESSDTWKISLSVALGVFVTLTGMIYHNLESRLSKVEDDALPRREFEIAHKAVQEYVDTSQRALKDQLGRIEGHLVNIDSRDLRKKL